MFKELNSTYSEEELGWVSDELELHSTTQLCITLPSKGRVTIKKRNVGEEEMPKIMVSPVTGPEFEFTLDGEPEGKVIQVVTTGDEEETNKPIIKYI